MSKFLDVLERIRDGVTAPLGFGATRAEKLPGIALVAHVSADHAGGLEAAATADAVLVSGAAGPDGLKQLAESLTMPSGPRVSSLSEEDSQAYQSGGADLLVFNLEGTAASALASEDIARILCVNTGLEEAELRSVAALPVDAFLISMTDVSGPWTLQDLAALGTISRRVDKYILLEVSQAPGKKDLETLRDVGVSALVVDAAALGAEGLGELKTALLDMPRPSTRSRARSRAILPGSAFATPAAPEPDDDDHDDDDE
jgi:hypothetical protein